MTPSHHFPRILHLPQWPALLSLASGQKKQATGLIDHSLSLEAGIGLQGWVLSKRVFGGLAATAPGDLRARELSVRSTYLPLLNCRIHRLLGSTRQSCAFSWILCHLAACRQLCKTARSFLIWCQCQRAWNSVSVFPIFPSPPPPPRPNQVLFHSCLPSLSLIPTTSFCTSPFKFRTLLTALPIPTPPEIKK